MLYNTIFAGFRSVQIKHTFMLITVHRRKTQPAIYLTVTTDCFTNPLSGLTPPCLFVCPKQEPKLLSISFLCF